MTKNELKQLIKECILEMSLPNVKVGNYKYHGFNSSQEQEIKDKIVQFHATSEDSVKQSIRDKFEEYYQYIVGRNPILSNIDVYPTDYQGKNTAVMDLVVGVVSDIPPEDIKNFIELTKGIGARHIPKGYELDKDLFGKYIKIKKID